MADWIIERMSTPTAIRAVFAVKVGLNLVYGVLSLLIVDVQPTWVIGVIFLLAGVLNLHPLVTMRSTRLIGMALTLSLGGCMFRAGAVIWAYSSGALQTTLPKVLMGVALWVGLALFGLIATLGATDQLGRGSGAHGSHPRRG